ncbi:epimerase [Amycolatopsis kentuckyensis]|uniref:epimerase n=1 Tax=Amycolatopsis kentuckyensis TaxID=218823 RepID=UPI00356702C8
MKIVLFGATGTVGQGVLAHCLAQPDVEEVLVVTRRGIGVEHPKLRELRHENFADYSAIAGEFAGYDACFWCLGRTASTLSGPEYLRVTRDFTLAAARMLAEVNPKLCFCFISAVGASPRARLKAARVKGETEQELWRIFPDTAYTVRPAHVQPMRLEGLERYSLGYRVATRLFPVLDRLLPKYMTTAERLGRVMVDVARHGAPTQVLEGFDLH